MMRVAVFGNAGGGKTTIARRLAELTGLPLYVLDMMQFTAGQIALVFLAIPAGYPETQFSEPLPVWLSQIFYIVIEIPAIACGLALRTLYDGWRRTPWPSR